MNVSLTPNLEQFVRDCAASGDYNNTSEVMREALRLFKRVEEERAAKMARLRATIQEGDDAVAQGDGVSVASDPALDAFFSEL